MTSKLKAVVIFGGPSTEHDVSIITGIQVIENLDPQKYEVLPVYWTQDNKFVTCSRFDKPKDILKNIHKENILVSWDVNAHQLILKSKTLFSKDKNIKVDVIFPALHGGWGEDGNIQGLLEIFDVPYTGCSSGSAYLSMDKNMFKNIMKAKGIKILPWQVIKKGGKDKLKVNFKFPVICKPNALGSSIGVKKCQNLTDVKAALELIFELDEKAIIEPYVVDLTEINCSVLGDEHHQSVSVCEKPVAKGEILNFEDKYLSGGKTKTGQKSGGMASLDRIIPADIPDKLARSVQDISKIAFKAIGAEGVVRVDCIYSKKSGDLVVNEINSIPGSYSFYLWEATGVSFRELLDRLVEIAKKSHSDKKQINKTFDSPVLDKFLAS